MAVVAANVRTSSAVGISDVAATKLYYKAKMGGVKRSRFLQPYPNNDKSR